MEQNHLIPKNYIPRRILKTAYRILLVSLTLFVTLQFTACSNSPEPNSTGEKLPFGVFPLNDVKWMEERSYSGGNEKVVDDTLINIYSNIFTTYSVRQISEIKAELYAYDSTITEEVHQNLKTGEKTTHTSTEVTVSELMGNIYLEDKKVYYTGKVNQGGIFIQNHDKSLMFDYNVNVGDTIDRTLKGLLNPLDLKYYINSIDSILVGNENIGYEYRKQYFIAVLPDPKYKHIVDYFTVVEGIGCIENFFHTLCKAHSDHKPMFNSAYYKGEKINIKNVEPSNFKDLLIFVGK